jgi:hypothetical protein
MHFLLTISPRLYCASLVKQSRALLASNPTRDSQAEGRVNDAALSRRLDRRDSLLLPQPLNARDMPQKTQRSNANTRETTQ